METKTIVEHDDIKKHLDYLQKNGYKYIVKAQDNLLSGWGLSDGKKHLHLIACKTTEELTIIVNDLHNDKTMSYVNWWFIKDTKNIINCTKNKSYTIRNDWTRCFKEKN